MKIKSLVSVCMIFLIWQSQSMYCSQKISNLKQIEEILFGQRESKILSDHELKHQVSLAANKRGNKSISCWRLYNDTIALISLCKNNGDRLLCATRSGNSLQQQKDISSFFLDHKDIQSCQVTVLRAVQDRDHLLDVSGDGWNSCAEGIRSLMGYSVHVVDYQMVPGDQYRNQDHFVCRLTDQGAMWQSAIDGFKEHKV